METPTNKKVSYFYDNDVGNFYYGESHPMKPQRIRMTHSLLLSYGLYRKMYVYKPGRATTEEIKEFHDEDYLKFLETVHPDNVKDFSQDLERFCVGEDCPVFSEMYDFCKISAGGSLSAAVNLNLQRSDIAINWMGGLHHAKKSEPSGFCYVNDIVLGILELLKYNKRVLYIDIDCHHGDGVEEAFLTTDRVMTVSFHKFGDGFFPNTGDVTDIGHGKGKKYTVNFPLRNGITDKSFESIFKPVITKVLESYQPNVAVLQCGADSLTGDRLGGYNLTLKGHGKCVEFMRKQNIPLMLLGGGGYTIRNVARCWTYETALALGTNIPNNLPKNDYYRYFGPDFKLHIQASNVVNNNCSRYLNLIQSKIFENLSSLPNSPSVPMNDIPDHFPGMADNETEAQANEDISDFRITAAMSAQYVEKPGELSDSEDEGDNRHNQQNYKFDSSETMDVDIGSNTYLGDDLPKDFSFK